MTSKKYRGIRGIHYELSCHMEKLRIVAKLTHNKYGTSRAAAVFDILKKLIMVIKMKNQRRTMTKKPISGDRNPKKIGDQIALSKSWIEKVKSASRFFLLGVL